MPNLETKTIGGIVVIGPTGAGKSTFLNNLVGKDIFQTSDEAEDEAIGCTKEGQHYVTENGLCVLDLPGFSDPNLSEEGWTALFVESLQRAKEAYPNFCLNSFAFINKATDKRAVVDTCITATLLEKIAS